MVANILFEADTLAPTEKLPLVQSMLSFVYVVHVTEAATLSIYIALFDVLDRSIDIRTCRHTADAALKDIDAVSIVAPAAFVPQTYRFVAVQ